MGCSGGASAHCSIYRKSGAIKRSPSSSELPTVATMARRRLLSELPKLRIVSACARTKMLFRSAYMAHLGGQAKSGSRSSFWSSALISAGILEKSPSRGRPLGASCTKRIA